MLIVVATKRPARLQDFIDELRRTPGTDVAVMAEEEDVLDVAKSKWLRLAVVDGAQGDGFCLELVRKILRINAMVNTAVLSALSEEDFHERSEGLGVLSQVSAQPGRADAALLREKLRGVLRA